jgi:hypothetical protein
MPRRVPLCLVAKFAIFPLVSHAGSMLFIEKLLTDSLLTDSLPSDRNSQKTANRLAQLALRGLFSSTDKPRCHSQHKVTDGIIALFLRFQINSDMTECSRDPSDSCPGIESCPFL